MKKVTGVVVKSTGRGQKLGFPTANLKVESDYEEGIYLADAQWEGQSRPALVFIGRALTFGETKKKFEVHLLNFQGRLYGKRLTVELIKKIRENKKFESVEELVRQMKKDLSQARKYFEKKGMI